MVMSLGTKDKTRRQYGCAPATIITNAGKARGYGGEFEGTARLVDNFQLNFGIAYLNAKYTDFISGNPATGARPAQLAGNWMRNAPNWTGSFSGVYTFPLANSAALTLQAGVHFQSNVYFDQFNDPSKGLGLYDANNNQGAYSVEIVRLGFRPAGGRWEISAYVSNVANKVYRTEGFEGSVPGNAAFLYYGAPRKEGVEVNLRF